MSKKYYPFKNITKQLPQYQHSGKENKTWTWKFISSLNKFLIIIYTCIFNRNKTEISEKKPRSRLYAGIVWSAFI